MGPKLMQFEAERISAEFQRIPADHAIPFMTLTYEEVKAMKKLFLAAEAAVHAWGQPVDMNPLMDELAIALAGVKK